MKLLLDRPAEEEDADGHYDCADGHERDAELGTAVVVVVAALEEGVEFVV